MVSRLAFLREVFRPRAAKLITVVLGLMAAYQFACDQFGAPTLPNLWGMTGASALPWWAWLLLAQLGGLYGLFEYVRRTAHDAVPAAGLRLQTGKFNNYELGRRVDAAVNSARSDLRRNSTSRGIEKAFFPIRALMITLTKEKGIRWPAETGKPQLDLEAVLRVMERIAPLIKAGHEKEAIEAANEIVERLNRASGAAEA